MKEETRNTLIGLAFLTVLPTVCGYLFGKNRGVMEEFKRLREAAGAYPFTDTKEILEKMDEEDEA